MTYGMIKMTLLLALGALSALLAYALAGPAGLAGSAVGVLFASLLSGASHLVLRRIQNADHRLLPFTAMLGVLVSFVLMAGFIFALAAWWRAVLVPATLTALVIYLSYRFFEAFELSGARSSGSTLRGAAASKGGER